MPSPKVSIIVPVYNVEKYLPECIDSILAQTFTDFELLLIDDGSPDNSGKICDEYAARDSRIRVFHKVNGGVSSARNMGLDNAKGEWITFVDSDDRIDNTYLFDFCADSDDWASELYVQGYQVIKDDNVVRKHFLSQSGPRHLSDCISVLEDRNLLNSPVCKLFKNDILKQYNIRFDTQTSYGEDHIFTLEYLCRIDTVFLCCTFGYNYVNRQNSLTNVIIPYEQLIYYYNKSMQLMSDINLKINHTKTDYLKSVNYRSFRTFTKLYKQIIHDENPVEKLKKARKSINNSNIYEGLKLKHRLQCYMYFKSNCNISIWLARLYS